jgi:hypothetical protein
MKATKTLNIDVSLHQELKIRAVGAGWPLGEFVEAVLHVGLGHPEELKRLVEGRTTTEVTPAPK